MIRALAAALGVAVLTACAPVGTGVETSAEPARAFQADAGGFVDSDSGLRVDFGRTVESTITAVTRLIGASPTSDIVNPECGAGPLRIVRWEVDGLDLMFQNGDFRGWAIGEAGIPTAANISVGMDRATLIARGAGIRPSTFGEEFSIAGLNGVLDDKGIVAAVWAGTACIFR